MCTMAKSSGKHANRIIALIAGLAFALALAPAAAFAVTDNQSGICGDGVTWTLDDGGTLTISKTGEGTGAINNQAFANRDDIKSVVIEDGVTSIGYMTFNKCKNLEKAAIPGSVKTIEQQAF